MPKKSPPPTDRRRELQFDRFYSGMARLAPGQGAATHRRRALGLVDSITSRLHRINAERAAWVDLHATDVQVLALLALGGRDGVLKASEIQSALGFTAGGVTRRLDSMTARGLVERLPDPDDGRAWLVRLTSAGAGVVGPMLADNVPRNARIEGEFSDAEWETLNALLARLLTALD